MFTRGFSSRLSLQQHPIKDGKLDPIPLRPFTSDTKGLFSQAEGKEYEKALNLAARHEWAKATETLQRIAPGPGKSAAVMLNLGVLQRIQGQNQDAEKSFLESARLDPGFAVPLVLAAEVEISLGDFQSAAAGLGTRDSNHPAAFPDAYASNAVANAVLRKADAAEASARQGLRIDTAHQFPELEYALGLTLYSKDEKQEARKQFESYLAHSPNGPNSATAKSVLAEMTQGSVPPPVQSERDNAPSQPEIAGSAPSIGDAPPLSRLQVANAAPLKKAPSETCLESVARSQTDERAPVRKASPAAM